MGSNHDNTQQTSKPVNHTQNTSNYAATNKMDTTTISSTDTKNKLEEKEKHKKKKSSNISNGSTSNNANPKSQQQIANRRQLEQEAYAAVITAFKAQGELTWKKETILQELRAVLKISDERHKMEGKRAEETLVQSQITQPVK